MGGKSNYPTIPDNASIVTARSSWQIMYLYFLRPIFVFCFFLFSSIYFSLYITSILFSFTFSSIAFLFTKRHVFYFISWFVKYFLKSISMFFFLSVVTVSLFYLFCVGTISRYRLHSGLTFSPTFLSILISYFVLFFILT